MSNTDSHTTLDGSIYRTIRTIIQFEWLRARSMLLFVCVFATMFAISLFLYLNARLAAVQTTLLVRFLIFFKAIIEIWCSLYAGYFIFISIYYLIWGRKSDRSLSESALPVECPSLVMVYLCCNDIDHKCLKSLCSTKSHGKLKILVHDDSTDLKEQDKVNAIIHSLSTKYRVDIQTLRRDNRGGGKPGALNYVLDQIPSSFEWMLICDNDSLAQDPDWYLRVAEELGDTRLAAVQFRNVGIESKADRSFYRNLGQSIDVFEVFVAPAERFGWLPFFGHNAILRLSAVREVGGFQPGEFADDIDMSLRLHLAKYRIHYRKDISFSEAHPDNYRAFRARSYKWAYGCASVIRRWGGTVLKSRDLTLQQKFFFFIFIGFYYTQIALLGYLFVTYILLPFLIPGYEFSPIFSILGGSLVIFLMYLPTLAYFIGNGRLRQWPAFAIIVGLVYGSIDFISARALIDCTLKRKRRWVPTNTVQGEYVIPWTSWLESLMGFSLLAIPYMLLPHLLYLPCTYLFALKFMVIPVLYLVYWEKVLPGNNQGV